MTLTNRLMICMFLGLAFWQEVGAVEKPNFIVIFADDLGYGDLGCYGHPSIQTPNLDRLAAEGLRFTDFYSAAEVCTPSRAALLTGRYPLRNGMYGARRVLFPNSHGGLPSSEITIAELLKTRGYSTAHIGKWHLGIHEGSRPLDQGFDFSYGLPYSNDMDSRANLPRGSSGSPNPPADGWNVPLIRNNEIIEQPVDQTTLTKRYTAEAARFIRERKREPFFLYFAHTFPHVPLFASPDFRGKSRRGIYGDAVEELDWSVGQVIAALRTEGVAERTLVFFTSDNGPWLIMGSQGGSAGLLREGKGSTWEGGMRVPGIAWWPGQIKPAVCNDVATTIDLLPTLANLSGSQEKLPDDRAIDGIDISDRLIREKPLASRTFFYYRAEKLMACRLGDWKAHFMTQAGYGQQKEEMHDPPLLYHLGMDPSEARNVAANHPEVLAEINAAVEAHRQAIVAAPTQLQ